MRFLVLSAVLFGTASFAAPELTRGPYLQLAGPTGITIVFRTATVSMAEVRFGNLGQALNGRVAELLPTTEHVMHLTGLTPLTSYEYEVVVDGVALAGRDPFRFKTYPPVGTGSPFRFFAWGDSGTGTNAQLQVAERLARDADEATLSLILGDIIYYVGEPELYDARFFGPYAPLLRRMVIWPTIGNHDVGLDPLGGPYLDAYYLPRNNPANTELYYSFDYGDAHFVCLDTHVSGHFSPSAPQLLWAAADLAASNAKWKFVYFHVPPYTGGTHADDPFIRDNILPVLEAAGVDVVFSGHSHVYERTYLLRGNTITQSDRSNYVRDVPDAGTLYVVSGTAGQSGGLSRPQHPLMAFQAGNVIGASVIDVNGDDLHGYFLTDDGTAIDLFHLSKGPDTTPPHIVTVRSLTPTQLEVVFDEPLFAGNGPGGAERLGAFDLQPFVRLFAARLQSDGRTVVLDTGALSPGAYQVGALGIGDRSGKGNLSNSRFSFDVRRRLELSVGRGSRFLLSDAGGDWREPIADESAWGTGDLPIGYGESGLGTTVQSGLTTLYVRTPFTLPVDKALVRRMELELDYDDGFVASLNGIEIARQNVWALQGPDTAASADRERGLTQRYLVGPRADALLRDDVNVLAIEVHNASAFSSDLFLSVRLTAEIDEPPDAGEIDAGVIDAGFDAGIPDAGELDAGFDAGLLPIDAGLDAGQPERDAGTSPADAGTNSMLGGGGCSCSSGPGVLGVVLVFLTQLCRSARRRRA
ncbi:MAG: metallophosphoesterase [Archangium sp.]|nr:metallophosphoesterase [Archangium sp.]